MAIRTVSNSAISYVNGSGYYAIDGKLYTQTAYDVYQDIDNPNNIVHGPGAGATDANNIPLTGSAPSYSYTEDFTSTDVVFLTQALGMGPIYRINPDGPLEIEANRSSIIDLVDEDGDIKTEDFYYDQRTGTDNQSPMPVFGDTAQRPRQFPNPISLKKGNFSSASEVELQSTDADAWDALRFNFIINSLYSQSDDGKTHPRLIRVKISIYDSSGTEKILERIKNISSRITSQTRISELMYIPAEKRSSQGYLFSISKITDDSEDLKIRDDISVEGWDQIQKVSLSYPGVALHAFAVKAEDQRSGAIPTFTSVIKGRIVKVPSNYNQPVIPRRDENGNITYEVDWREVEVNTEKRATNGITLQDNPTAVLTGNSARYPEIYKGGFDGTLKYDYTQNMMWIIYDILTNKDVGLGIPESQIDVYNFYSNAMYLDSVDPRTGRFSDFAKTTGDGSYEHKPRGEYTDVRQTLEGSPTSEQVDERRFVTNITIDAHQNAYDLINRLLASVRGTIRYAGNKVSVVIDKPETLPVKTFNPTNIKKGSITRSGISESDLITTVEVTYVEPQKSFERDTIVIDTADRNNGEVVSSYEKRVNLDILGCTRKSQALRAAQYYIASSEYSRARVQFTTGSEALNLSPGELIAVSGNMYGINYGFSGRVKNNVPSSSNVVLEHYTNPPITPSLFTENTYPLALRLSNVQTDTSRLYILEDSYSIRDEGATVEVTCATSVLDDGTKVVENPIQANPHDYWSIGEWPDAGNVATPMSDERFKILEMTRDADSGEVDIFCEEYVPEIYTDSEQFIDAPTTNILKPSSSRIAPPVPQITLQPNEVVNRDGSAGLDLIVGVNTNKQTYRGGYVTEIFSAEPTSIRHVNQIASPETGKFRLGTSNVSVSSNTHVLTGKNGFTSEVGKITLFCDNVEKNITSSKNSLGLIKFTIPSITNIASREGVDPKVGDYISIPIIDKTRTSSFEVNKLSVVSTITEQIIQIDNNGTSFYINDKSSGSNRISTSIPDTPFEIVIKQKVDLVNSNQYFVEGKRDIRVYEGGIVDLSNVSINIGTIPRHKSDITLEVDGRDRDFNLSNSIVSFRPEADDDIYRLTAEFIRSPVFEIGDPIVIDSGESFRVANASYLHDTNMALTSNNMYYITLDKTPRTNIQNKTFINVSKDPRGTVVESSPTTVDLSYSTAEYPGNFTLRDVYSIVDNPNLSALNSDETTIKNVGLGPVMVVARNKNDAGILSSYVTKTIDVKTTLLGGITELKIKETYEIGALRGVILSAEVSFLPSPDERVTDYEISSRTLNSDSIPISDWSTVKVSAKATSDDGKIYYKQVGVEPGPQKNNQIQFRIVPINKNIRGSSSFIKRTISGKSVPPKNIYNFSVGQIDRLLNMRWDYEVDNKGKPADDDLVGVVIRRLPGRHAATTDNFLRSTEVDSIAAPSKNISFVIDDFGLYTYFAKTLDSSGNYSDSVVAVTINVTQPEGDHIIARFSEDNPTSTDRNSGETNFPSLYSNSYSSGGNTIGFTTTTNPTDILATSNAQYTTKVRDIGSELDCVVYLGVNAAQSINTNYNDQYALERTGRTNRYIPTGEIVYGDWRGVNLGRSFGVDFNEFTANASGNFDYFTGSNVPPGITSTSSYVQFVENGKEKQLICSGRDNFTTQSFGNLKNFWRERNVGSSTWGSWSNNISSFLTDNLNQQFTSPKVFLSNTSVVGNPFDNLEDSDILYAITYYSARLTQDIVFNATTDYRFTRRVDDDAAPTVTLVDTGIGSYFNSKPGLRYSEIAETLVSDNGNDIWAIRNPGQYSGDVSNTGAYSLLAGVLDDNTLALGQTFFANGYPTGTNNFSNVVSNDNDYEVINLLQFNDPQAQEQTFQGDLGVITSQVSIRSATSNPIGGNGEIDDNVFSSWVKYTPEKQNRRYIQLRLDVTNSRTNDYDYFLDKFNYTIAREEIERVFDATYNNGSGDVNMTSAGFYTVPFIDVNVTGTSEAVNYTISNLTTTFVRISLTKLDGTSYTGAANIKVRAKGS